MGNKEKARKQIIAWTMVVFGSIGMVIAASYIVMLLAQWLSPYPIWLDWLVGLGGFIAFVAGVVLLLPKHIYSTKKNHKADDTNHPVGS